MEYEHERVEEIFARDLAEMDAEKAEIENAYWLTICRSLPTGALLRIAADFEDLNYATATYDEIAARETSNYVLKERGV